MTHEADSTALENPSGNFNTDLTNSLKEVLAEQGESLKEAPFILQSPQEFRDDFIRAASLATEQVVVDTMQFEVGQNTQPLFDALADAKQRGVWDVQFRYDRVARDHIRAGEDEARAYKGRTISHIGNKQALKQANQAREELISEFERQGITKPEYKVRGELPRLSHNHAKLAIVDDEAWFGTMNLRELDFAISNFMLKVTDPQIVEQLKEVFKAVQSPDLTKDLTFSNDGNTIELMMDAGVKGQSAIYDKAMEMAASLEPGDEFTMISQWPPVRMAFGPLVDVLKAKMQVGAKGTYLMSPTEYLHPLRPAANALQKSVDKQEKDNPNMTAINLVDQTHAKALMIKRANGEIEVLFGSHNFTERTVKNGTRELAMWTKDPAIATQIEVFLQHVKE